MINLIARIEAIDRENMEFDKTKLEEIRKLKKEIVNYLELLEALENDLVEACTHVETKIKDNHIVQCKNCGLYITKKDKNDRL